MTLNFPTFSLKNYRGKCLGLEESTVEEVHKCIWNTGVVLSMPYHIIAVKGYGKCQSAPLWLIVRSWKGSAGETTDDEVYSR